MNVSPQPQPKRTIKVKEFLQDFHAGVSDHELMEKYHLTTTGIGRFYDMLQDRGILTEADFNARAAMEEEQESAPEQDESAAAYFCPRCGAGHDSPSHVCSNCGDSPENVFDQPIAKNDNFAVQESAPQDLNHEFAGPYGTPNEAPLDFGLDPEDNYPISQEESIGVDSIDFSESTITCDHCETPMDPVIRVIYDRGRSLKSIYIAAGVFLLSLLSASSLHFFDGYSFTRLLVIYATIVAFLTGAVFLGVGAFMLLAREKVYQCGSCLRIYPRA